MHAVTFVNEMYSFSDLWSVRSTNEAEADIHQESSLSSCKDDRQIQNPQQDTKMGGLEFPGMHQSFCP